MTPAELAAERAASRERKLAESRDVIDDLKALRAQEDKRRPYSDRSRAKRKPDA